MPFLRQLKVEHYLALYILQFCFSKSKFWLDFLPQYFSLSELDKKNFKMYFRYKIREKYISIIEIFRVIYFVSRNKKNHKTLFKITTLLKSAKFLI